MSNEGRESEPRVPECEYPDIKSSWPSGEPQSSTPAAGTEAAWPSLLPLIRTSLKFPCPGENFSQPQRDGHRAQRPWRSPAGSAVETEHLGSPPVLPQREPRKTLDENKHLSSSPHPSGFLPWFSPTLHLQLLMPI